MGYPSIRKARKSLVQCSISALMRLSATAKKLSLQSVEIGDDIVGASGVPHPGQRHTCSGHELGWRHGPGLQLVVGPDDLRTLQRGRVVEARKRSGLASGDAEEIGTDAIAAALVDRVAGLTDRKGLLALLRVGR